MAVPPLARAAQVSPPNQAAPSDPLNAPWTQPTTFTPLLEDRCGPREGGTAAQARPTSSGTLCRRRRHPRALPLTAALHFGFGRLCLGVPPAAWPEAAAAACMASFSSSPMPSSWLLQNRGRRLHRAWLPPPAHAAKRAAQQVPLRRAAPVLHAAGHQEQRPVQRRSQAGIQARPGAPRGDRCASGVLDVGAGRAELAAAACSCLPGRQTCSAASCTAQRAWCASPTSTTLLLPPSRRHCHPGRHRRPRLWPDREDGGRVDWPACG